MNIVGIDIGTTGVCGVSMDAKTGIVKKSITKNSDAFIIGSSEWEKVQSVERIITVAKEISDSLTDAETAAIGVCGQMHGIVYTDKEGRAVSDLYTWQDGRGNLPYKDSTYAEYMKSHSGYGAVTDFYNRENGLRPHDAAGYCTIQDYLVMDICSLASPVIHETDFAGFGDGAECESGKVVSGYALAGKYKDIPVAVAIGDNQASVFSTLTDDDSLLINVGTGSQVSLISEEAVKSENLETRPYFDGKYLVVGSALCGGRAYSILKDFFKGILKDATESEIYSRMAELADGVTPTLEVDTRFAGTRKDKNITGSIRNIREDNFTPGELIFGVIDGMVTELYNMYKEMNFEKTKIVGSGNGIRKNKILVKCAEEKFKGKMLIPAHVEEAACGAALYAGVSAGIFKSSDEAHKLIKYD